MLLQTTGIHLTKIFGNKPKPFILTLSCLAVLVIGFLDYALPYQISMSVFYMLPIMFVAWYADKKNGDLIALFALIITWWTDELTMPIESLGWIHTYRMLVRLFFFLFFSMGAAALKARRDLSTAQIDLLERSRRLEREIIKISDREQQRIGQDLHDGLCQYLAALSCAAVSLKDDLCKLSLEEETRAAAELAELLKQGVTQARNLAHGLSPVHDDEGGLDCALQELATSASRMLNITCEFTPGAEFYVRDNTTAAHLYRIAQEALNNATRHGQATRVDITLGEERGHIILRITDNGKGLTPTTAKKTGMGQKIMDYRARSIGGELTIANNPEGESGVTITCAFPLQTAPVPPAEPAPEHPALVFATA